MTLPGVLLWNVLRARPNGWKFRRQHGSDKFVIDLYCKDARVVIEVDGFERSTGDHPQRDAARDAFFAEAGITTLRIPASEALCNLEAGARGIVEVARSRLPLHHSAAPGGTPPRDELGED